MSDDQRQNRRTGGDNPHTYGNNRKQNGGYRAKTGENHHQGGNYAHSNNGPRRFGPTADSRPAFQGEHRSASGEKPAFRGEHRPMNGEKPAFRGERRPMNGGPRPVPARKPAHAHTDGMPARRIAL